MITKTHPVVEKILDNEELDDYTKLLAVSEILNLYDRHKKSPLTSPVFGEEFAFGENIDNIDELFSWEDSELGVDFWRDISEIVWDNQGSCGFW